MNARVPVLFNPQRAGALLRKGPSVRRCARTAHIGIVVAQEQVWRPSLDDVQRISSGGSARSRGTGSRAVPHRLNADERKLWDLAKQKGVLTLGGSGYRRERKGSPLANIWRQWCDAKALPCILLAKGGSADSGDTVLVDLSTLRLPDASQYREACRAIARQHGVAPQPEDAYASPFTVIMPLPLVDALMAEQGAACNSSGSSSSSGGSSSGSIEASGSGDPSGAAEVAAGAAEAAGAAAEAAAGAAADEAIQPGAATGIPSGSSSGSSGGSVSSSSAVGLSAVEQELAELRSTAPIWQHPPQLECFTGDRAAAKALAKHLAEEALKKQLGQLGSTIQSGSTSPALKASAPTC